MNGSSGEDLTSTAVLALLGRAGPMSRAALARDLGMSPATLTQVTRRLLTQGVIEELDRQEPSRGGRRGRLIGLVGSAGRALGVKVAVDHVALVDMRLDGRVTETMTVPFDATALEAVPAIAELLRPFTESAQGVPPLLGIGVGVPGTVDRPDSGVVDAAMLNWENVPLGTMLGASLGLAVLVENDVNALGSGERLYGRGRSLNDFLVVTIGRGIGLAVVAGGHVYRGAHGGAGDFGHVPVDPDGPPCTCGSRGCLEALISDDALLRTARSAGILGEGATPADLADLANGSDGANGADGSNGANNSDGADDRTATARRVLCEAGQLLGRQLAGLATLLDPQEIVVMGEGTRSWPWWEPGVREAFERHAPRRARELAITVEPYTETIWAQGAAALVLAASLDGGVGSVDPRRRIHGLGGAAVERTVR
ncbi:ROK family protein [Streptomyces sp. NPDC008139]|uniref:ROK family protein n=1 Tax=Streptomyces sp. NPDC008139 TaxID=3364814 RepID=UPI0036E92F54